jgi:hypothetical protein
VDALKQSIAKIPVVGSTLLTAWRLFKDPYLGPIEQQISARLPKWKARTVVQIGANDGSRSDPISALLKNRVRWKVLFVEPIPSAFEQLVKNYGSAPRFMFEQAAVSDVAGSFSFFF